MSRIDKEGKSPHGGFDWYKAEQEKTLRRKLGDDVYEWLERKAVKMDPKRLLAKYGRLFSFLRVVPLMEGNGIYLYVRKERESGEHRDPDAPWLIERELRDFRTVRNGDGLCGLLWLPNDLRFRNPTFDEFSRAYGRAV